MWHYSEGGEPKGPFSAEEIQEFVQSGKIHPGTLLWSKGMTEWLPAYKTNLNFLFKPSSIPPTASFAAPEPVQPAATTASTRSNKKLVNTIVMIVSAVLGFLLMQFLPRTFALRIFGGGIAGLICGLLPYFVGKQKNPKLAKQALSVCCVSGMAFGILLGLPVAIAYTIVISVKPPIPAER